MTRENVVCSSWTVVIIASASVGNRQRASTVAAAQQATEERSRRAVLALLSERENLLCRQIDLGTHDLRDSNAVPFFLGPLACTRPWPSATGVAVDKLDDAAILNMPASVGLVLE